MNVIKNIKREKKSIYMYISIIYKVFSPKIKIHNIIHTINTFLLHKYV